MRKVLFLDVDGVVNIGSRSPETSDFRAGGLDLIVRPDLIEALQALSRRGDIEIAFLTTWLELPEALDELEAVLSVSFLRPEVRPGSRACWSLTWWKLATLHAFLEEGDFWVWVDDDLSPDPQDSTRVILQERYPRGRPVSVSGRTGLSPSHLAELVARLESQTDDEPMNDAAIYKNFVEQGLRVDELAASLGLPVSEIGVAVEQGRAAPPPRIYLENLRHQGRWAKELRLRAGRTREDVAGEIGAEASWVEAVEAGRVAGQPGLLPRLFAALGSEQANFVVAD